MARRQQAEASISRIDPADAAARRLRKEAELNAKNNGVAVAAPESTNGRRPLGAAIADYLEEIKLGRKDKTYVAYDLSLRYFAESCSKIFVMRSNAKTCSNLRHSSAMRRNKRRVRVGTSSQTSCLF